MEGKNIKVITNGTLIDGTGKQPVEHAVVVLNKSKISTVGTEKSVTIPKGEDVEIIDAKGMTILPGLIDSHVHMQIQGQSSAFYSMPLHNNSIDLTLTAVPLLKKTLEMGITTLRDGGSGWDWMEVSLRRAIERGDIVGPRYLTSGYHLTVTGGHGVFLPPWFAYAKHSQASGIYCDGPEEWRKAARINLSNGTDCIKLVASRGFLSAGSRGDASPTASQPSVEELQAAVDEAHKMGKKVFAHANGPDAIKKSIIAGVDSIVHGFYIDQECLELMVKHDVILEPTTLCIKLVRDQGKGEMHDSMVEKATAYYEKKAEEFSMILDSGVKISFASDMGCPYLYHGENASELMNCVDLGMSPIDAIGCATKTAALAVGLEDQIGTIETDKNADIILVDGNPLQDISILREESKIKMVLKDGECVIRR